MEYISIEGNENDIIKKLSQYMNQGSAKLLIRNFSFFKGIYSDEEVYEKCSDMQTNGANLIIGGRYYLNMKLTTIALIGLLLDIKFTKGFAAFVFGIFGGTADAIRKLENEEKCILLLVKSNSVIAVNENQYSLLGHPICIDFILSCQHREYNNCNINSELLSATIKKLKELNIISQTGTKLTYNF